MEVRSRLLPISAARWPLGLLAIALMLLSAAAAAAPEAHILRIDPRAKKTSGAPIITTVIELQQSKRISKATAKCSSMRGSTRLSCMAEALQKPLYSTLPFPKNNALFTVSVDGTDRPSKLISVESWGKSQKQPGVGTAWLILIDADSRMKRTFEDAKQVATRFVSSMGPNDIVNLMFFNDRQVFEDSGWLAASKKKEAQRFVSAVKSTMAKQGRNRPLLTIIKNAATDGFKALGNAGSKTKIPLHQAMVLLSSGFGGTDPSTTGPGAAKLAEYMTAGRFPENNTALPKTPVPVISIYFPTRTYDEFANNSLEFMQNAANPQIGGFFNIVQAGEGQRASGIVNAVRTRFSKMLIAKWRVSCLAPSITQTFQLVFKQVDPPIAGDASFKDVPIGVDPTGWPLDVDVERTQAGIGEGVYPGGSFKVYGDFCWAGDTQRAEVYFVPAGQSLPTDLSSADAQQAKRAQQQLIGMGMRGQSLQSTDTFAEFKAPDNEKLIHGSGSQAVARLVLYDNKAHRMSGITAETIVQVKATSAPFPIVLILGGLFGATLLALLLVVVLRTSSGKRRPSSGNQKPAPRPIQAAATNPDPLSVSRATLRGSDGVFTVASGEELRAGRDAAACGLVLPVGQVSSVHATFKLEDGRLSVRDEGSTHGTFVAGTQIATGQWHVVPHGERVRLGPSEFSVTLE